MLFRRSGFTKLPRQKKFEYSPRYFDEDKREMEKRIKFVRSEAERESREQSEGMQFRSQFHERQSSGQLAGVRVLIIFFTLLLIAIWILLK